MAPDVLAVQEVEDKFTLDSFNAEDLGGRFPHRVLVEGNDPRFIDVGLMSRLPLGEVRSYQHWVHPESPNERVFRRDLLAAEVLSEDRRRTLFWVLVAHLKSQYVDWRVKGEAQRRWVENQALATRRFEAEAIATIVRERIGDAVPVFVCGDLNDHPGSPALQPLLGTGRKCLGMVNLVARDQGEGDRWTTSHKETGVDREFTQLDYVLVTQRFAGLVSGARVVRRETRVTQADGSDHDPVVCEFRVDN
jgi:endonuclease/exonuclease/phosphatase family metal-dependent hydrolase